MLEIPTINAEAIDILLRYAALMGGLAFAFSGALVGLRKKLDLMGLLILAFLTANGGGILRDLLIQKTPRLFFDQEAFWVAGAAVLSVFILQKRRQLWLESHFLFIVMDAIGLVAFAISGALIGLAQGFHLFGVMTLAFLTATGGGIARDLLVNEIPLILQRDFYGSIALILAVIVYFTAKMLFLSPLLFIMIFSAGLVLRLYAYQKKWHLPRL